MGTYTGTEKELTFVEDFENTKPGSNFAVFIFTWLGIIVGIMFSTNIKGFLMGGYNVGKIITIVPYGVIGFYLGTLTKRMIDKSLFVPDNVLNECDLQRMH
uniref:Transmembrane protein n=1 Tax=Mimivirus LCMiAC02 TaxID=2506609 RepID=A0A481Z0I9_9VIRU|nr:MAG: hypothetical protein LCMiAC02_01160 [Mimivirus LCMiAC02]